MVRSALGHLADIHGRRLQVSFRLKTDGSQRVCNDPLSEGADCPIIGGEGGIRTHGADNRTTAFEFQDSRVGACRAVAKRAVLFAIFPLTILACDAQCRAVPPGSFADSFAKKSDLPELGGSHL
jgi:hypothetical protein